MTEKELLYIQDAISHAKHAYTKCINLSNQLQDENLRNFTLAVAQKHQQVHDALYRLLNK